MKHASTILAIAGLALVVFAMRKQGSAAVAATEKTASIAVPKGALGEQTPVSPVAGPLASPAAVPAASPAPIALGLTRDEDGRKTNPDAPGIPGSSFLNRFLLA